MSPLALARLEDLAALVTEARGKGRAAASVPTAQLADWLAGWRADRLGRADAEAERDRWRVRARRSRRGATQARAQGRGGEARWR